MKVTAVEIAVFLGAELHGDPGCEVRSVSKLLPGQAGALSFCKQGQSDPFALVNGSLSAVIICLKGPSWPGVLDKTLILTPNPRLGFMKAVAEFFPWRNFRPGVDPTAVVSPKANIHPSASIGPRCVIYDDVEIGADSALNGSVVIRPVAY